MPRSRFIKVSESRSAGVACSVTEGGSQDVVKIAAENWDSIRRNPHVQASEDLREAMRKLRAGDVGISENLDMSSWERAGYIEIYQDENINVGIFLLPEGKSIPLHDHPDMTVFTKVLLGTLSVCSYDWLDECDISKCPTDGAKMSRPARLAFKDDFFPDSGLLELYPRRSNLHTFKATKACAFIDVVLPSYCDDRPCTYYRELTVDELSEVLEAELVVGNVNPHGENGQNGHVLDADDDHHGCAQPCGCGGSVHLVSTSAHFDVESLPYKGPVIPLRTCR